ncbi:MAG TPA: DUF3179 domain-containing (seleno)protein [Methylomirabilota bacterium]|nr:DUF3179 domain-containing (seleno)protein [Methylomirabilota bacterium]
MAWGARSVLAAVILAGCSAGPAMPDEGAATPLPTGVTPSASPPWPIAPEPPPGPLDAGTADAVDRLVTSFVDGSLDMEALDIVATSADARLGWILSDLLRFAAPGTLRETALGDAFATLAGFDPRADQRFGHDDWLATTNLLIGWDLAAPTGYRDHKAALFLAVEPAWEPFFADTGSAIDWRWISWGGVFIDDRPIGDAQACRRSCIPALDDPALTTAAEGTWYLDGQTIFGIVVNGEAVAFPKHIMEVHEMVNLTVGGRRVGLPYCTLCGSAQAYLTDAVPVGIETPVLRTSGLLSRSNKVMYDLVTRSAFNTFTGQAVSGPLREAGLELERTSVVVTSWGEWKAAHPATRIVAQDGGIGRTYANEPLAGRDLGGPIFPVGPVDPRLPAQTAVLGVIDEDGDAIAFPVEQAVGELTSGAAVVVGEVEAYLDGGGLRVRTVGGEELPANQSFWFAWSQFHPATVVWAPTGP